MKNKSFLRLSKKKYLISLLNFIFAFVIISCIHANELASTNEISLSSKSSVKNENTENKTNEILIKTNDFEINFSKLGGIISDFKLLNKKFNDNFWLSNKTLKNQDVLVPKPFTIKLYVKNDTDSVLIDDTNFLYELKHEKVDQNDKLIFSYSTTINETNNITIIKSYLINKIKRTIQFSIKIKNLSNNSITFSKSHQENIGLSLQFISNIGQNAHDDECVANFNGSLYKKMATSDHYSYEFKPSDINTIKWFATRDNYYVAILSFDNKKPINAIYKAIENGELSHSLGYASTLKINFPTFSIDANESETLSFTTYFGIKSYDELKNIGFGFEEICEFNFLALLILKALFFFYNITKNYGLAIILLTIAIKILLQPLTNKQTQSMKEMQKIQPYILEIKKKYPDNIQKQNEEIMHLYKTHGINPFAGCLPLLLQLPILFALFTALRTSVELKGEGFLWLTDLSMPDSTWILPLLIAISMHIQQAQMQIDPNQASAFQFMPILMFFITYTLPSGVLLYWGMSNILQIIQQWYDNRLEVTANGNNVALQEVKNEKGGKK